MTSQYHAGRSTYGCQPLRNGNVVVGSAQDRTDAQLAALTQTVTLLAEDVRKMGATVFQANCAAGLHACRAAHDISEKTLQRKVPEPARKRLKPSTSRSGLTCAFANAGPRGNRSTEHGRPRLQMRERIDCPPMPRPPIAT